MNDKFKVKVLKNLSCSLRSSIRLSAKFVSKLWILWALLFHEVLYIILLNLNDNLTWKTILGLGIHFSGFCFFYLTILLGLICRTSLASSAVRYGISFVYKFLLLILLLSILFFYLKLLSFQLQCVLEFFCSSYFHWDISGCLI